ncbi:MAG: hypothetical protein H6575_01115 [Lewinellaceae bacterium]|nr:hypothetical protein [Saprospiraceae bacterium]MCB9353148.1 hypothetical protein [Lewinellaceae bacterium]
MRYSTLFRFGSWVLVATAGIHMLSFIGTPEPANETERQLLDLMANYKKDMGAGVMRSTAEIVTFLSLCMTFLCFFAGVSNLIAARQFDDRVFAGRLIAFNVLFWTVLLIPLYLLTFVPPQVCFTLAWLGFVGAYWRFRSGG